MDFEQLMGILRDPGPDGLPGTIYDDLTAAYQDATTTRDAKIGEMSDVVQSYESEISRLKAMNYDLLIASGAGQQNSDSDDGDSDDDGDDESDTITTDSLFGKDD